MTKGEIAIFLFLALSCGANCQILQERPGVCGEPDTASIPVPRDVTAAPGYGGMDLFVPGSSKGITLWSGFPIEQICELGGAKMAVFQNWVVVSVVDLNTHSLVDYFLGREFVISPDRRWMVFDKFAPPNPEVPTSGEVLLYDFSKTPAQNRPTGVVRPDDLQDNVGTAVYPVGWKNEMGDIYDAPAEQRHGTGYFFWAPDSKALAFMDYIQERRQLVYVTIDQAGKTSAVVSPIAGTLPCEPYVRRLTPDTTMVPTQIKSIEFGPKVGSDHALFVVFTNGACNSETLQVHTQDFVPAKPETRVMKSSGRKVVKGDDQ